MKPKNVARLFIFVFVLCFVFLSLGWSQIEWKIPQSIIDAYPTNLEEVKDELKKDLGRLGALLRYHHNDKNEWDRIGKLLAKHGTVFYLDDGSVVSGKKDIKNFFQNNSSYNVNIQPQIEINFLDFEGEVDGEEVDIVAIVNFAINFVAKTEKDPQSLDPPGTMTLFHRKICVWR